jgi:hypothetical protein
MLDLASRHQTPELDGESCGILQVKEGERLHLPFLISHLVISDLISDFEFRDSWSRCSCGFVLFRGSFAGDGMRTIHKTTRSTTNEGRK